MILILSTPRDEHAQMVIAELLKQGGRTHILDLSEFPQHLGLVMRYEHGKCRFVFGCDQSGLNLNDCRAVWWRRPQSPEISPMVTRTSQRWFALNESVEALYGLWHALDAFWVNDPARDQVAQRKAFQLRVAQDIGLAIPATLMQCAQ